MTDGTREFPVYEGNLEWLNDAPFELKKAWEDSVPDALRDPYSELPQDQLEGILSGLADSKERRQARQQELDSTVAHFRERGAIIDEQGGSSDNVWKTIIPILALGFGISETELFDIVGRGSTDVKHCETSFVLKGITEFVDAEDRYRLQGNGSGKYMIQILERDSGWQDLIDIELVAERVDSGESPQTKVIIGRPKIQGVISILSDAKDTAPLVERFVRSIGGERLLEGNLGKMLGAAGSALNLLNDKVLDPFKDITVRWQLWAAIDKAVNKRQKHYFALEDEAKEKKRKLAVALRRLEAYKSCPACGVPYVAAETTCENCGTPRLSESLEAQKTDYKLVEA